MKNVYFLLIIVFFIGCGSGSKYEKAEDAQDAGREFIRASLDGDHKKARFYMLKDSTNLLLMEQQEKNYMQLSNKEKSQHHSSSINPISIQAVNDTVTAYTYINSYNKKDTTTINIVKSMGDWLVDLKSILKQ